MFSCCQTQNHILDSPEAGHRNPIHQRLGKRTKNRRKNASPGLNHTLPTLNHHRFEESDKEQTVFPTSETMLEQSELHLPTSSQLPSTINPSFDLPHSPVQIVAEPSAGEKKLKALKGKVHALQDKYIGILERTNNLLEQQLEKSHHRPEKTYSSRLRIDSNHKPIKKELSELKQRLNSIDLSGVKKIANLYPETPNNSTLRTLR